MHSRTTNFYGIVLEVFGTYEESEEETNYKGGFVGVKYFHENEDISCLLSETTKEQIDEQIASEI